MSPSLLESCALPLVVVDEAGMIEQTSPGWEQLYGAAPRPDRTPALLWSLIADPNAAAALADGARAGSTIQAVAVELLRENAERVKVLLSISPLADPRAAAPRRLVVAMPAAVVPQEARPSAVVSSAMAGVVGLSMAHDLANLLAAIVPQAEVLAEVAATASREEIAVAARRLSESLGLGADLTRQLAGFSALAADDPPPLDVGDTIGGLTSLLEQLIAPHAVLSFDVPADMTITAQVHKVELQQIVINLVLNAKDAVARNGMIGVSARAANEVPGGAVEIVVADNGAGISADLLPRVFDPFVSTKGRTGGGLGLPLLRAIVERRGGSIAIESEPGNGTRVRVLLPQSRPSAAGTAASAPARGFAPPPMSSAKARILVVDDEPGVASAIKTAACHLGYEVECLSTGQAALACLRDRPDGFHLALVDRHLPDIAGDELARIAKQLSPNLVTVFCSGDARPKGPELTLQKPFSLGELDGLIVRALAHRA